MMTSTTRRLIVAIALTASAGAGIWIAQTWRPAQPVPVSQPVARIAGLEIAESPRITISISADRPAQIVVVTPAPASTATETPQATQTPVESSTATETPTTAPSPSTTPTAQSTHTPAPTNTPAPTATPTVAPTATPMPPRTATATPGGGSPLAAFPGAEGAGSQAVGGRGGRVYAVTTLADSGTGSLRECVTASGPRICVFRTGGTIELKSTLTVANPYLTIAGQTAPGGGITLKVADPSRSIDMFKITTYEVVVRYIRFRPGTKGQDARALTINAGGSAPAERVARNIVIDHCSFSWAGDEIIIAWDRTHDVTFSWNIFSESLTPGLKGPNLGKYGGGPYSIHHNLIAFHSYRLPNASASGGTTDVVNNVIYNFRSFGMRALLGAMINLRGNWIEAGPDTATGSYYVRNDLDVPDPDSSVPLPNPTSRGFYLGGNILQAEYNGAARIRGILPPSTKAADIKSAPYPAAPVSYTSAAAAYDQVLDNAGAVQALTCDGTWVARSDAVDARIVEAVRLKRSSHNLPTPKLGYIASPDDVGGWPPLGTGEPCADSDGDGMFDAFEARMKYGVNVPDGVVVEESGYTRMDIFLAGVR